MAEHLSAEEYQKILDLRRIYGTSETAEYLDVNRSVVEFLLIRINGEQVAGIRSSAARNIRRGIRLYWKAWMGKHRDWKPLDKRYRVISIEQEGAITCPSSPIAVPAQEPESSTLQL